MKNKKSLLGLGLLALVLVLGVGYAVVSNVNLNITGTATVADSTLNVKFTGTPVTGGKGTTTATIADDALAATIKVEGLTKVGDTATATYTILNNESDLNAKITEVEISNDKTNYFEVTTSLTEAGLPIESGRTGEVTVTVKLVKMPVETISANIGVKLLATPVEK